MSPIISVIVPCFNLAHFLAEALDSVLAQSFTNWECLIVNDGSSDNTEEVAAGYCALDSRIKYIAKQNGGIASARNAGIFEAKGNLILPLDADDKIAPVYLEKAYTAHFNNPKLKLVYGEAELFGDMSGRWMLPDYNFLDLLAANMIYCSGIFRKEDFLEVGGYSEEMVHGFEDWDFWIRLLKGDAEVLKLPDVVFYYRRLNVSRSSKLLEEGKQELTQRLMFELNKDIYLDYLPPLFKKVDQYRRKNIELERQLNLIRNSKVYKGVTGLLSWRHKF